MVPWYRQINRQQKAILLVAWLGWVFDVADAALFNFAKIPMLTQMMGADGYKAHGSAMEAQIQMLFLAGWSLGGLLFGILADRLGRTKVLVWTIALYCLFTGLTALCQTPDHVMIIRFLTGIGIGGEWAAGAALVAESVPKSARAGAASFLQTAAAFGPMLAATCQILLKDQSWHALFIAGIFPALLAVFIRMKMHASEKPIERPQNHNELVEIAKTPNLRKAAIVAVLLGVVGIAGAGNVSFWLPNLVKSLSVGLADVDVKSRTSLATYILHIGTLAGVFAFPWLCNRMGRRGAFALFFAAAPISLAVVALAHNYNTFLVLCPILSFVAIGLTSGYGLYFPELFPARVRATGAGLGYNTGRILSIPIPLITATLSQRMGGIGTGMVMASLLYVIGLAVLPFAPETMGKELD